jgi:hypothetical protein
MRRLGVLLVLAACGEVEGNAPADGHPEGPPDARACFGSFFNLCLSALPTGPLTLSAPIDTYNVFAEPRVSRSPASTRA